MVGFEHVFPPDVYEFPADAIRAEWIAALANPCGQARGIGSTLHDFALDRLRQTNVKEARLWTLTENHRARAFYEKRGWTLTGRTRVVPFPPHPDRRRYAHSIPRS